MVKIIEFCVSISMGATALALAALVCVGCYVLIKKVLSIRI